VNAASGSVVAQLSDGAVVQATLMGMPFGPSHLLGVHIRSLGLVGRGMALSHDRLMTTLLLLAMAHPFHKQGLALSATDRCVAHDFLRNRSMGSFCSNQYSSDDCSKKRDLGSAGHTDPPLAPGHRDVTRDPLEWWTAASLRHSMADQLTKLAYKALQQGKSLAGVAHKEVSTKLMELVAPEGAPKTRPIPPQMLGDLQAANNALMELDWQEAEEGLYPTSLLFDAPWLDWATRYPMVWLDMPSTWNRRSERNVNDLPQEIESENYPDYYLQNFHHQTDGYLSDHSASLYDLQVEILFNGTADPMRRRVIKPLIQGLRAFTDRPASQLRVLDVATGTGRTLRQVRAALPETQLVGLDLSSAYLRQANRWLSQLPNELPQLVQGNGETMPFASGSMQGITCVFLLHELPGEARQNVINDCFRLLEPGGVLVMADSVQLADSPQFEPAMDNFRRMFHEPYYRDYIADDIDARLSTAGFTGIRASSHLMTRVWSATKP